MSKGRLDQGLGLAPPCLTVILAPKRKKSVKIQLAGPIFLAIPANLNVPRPSMQRDSE